MLADAFDWFRALLALLMAALTVRALTAPGVFHELGWYAGILVACVPLWIAFGIQSMPSRRVQRALRRLFYR